MATQPNAPSFSDQYGDHVIAFVDILGFAELIKALDADSKLIDDLYGVFSGIAEPHISWAFGDLVKEGLATVTAASDSIFFSVAFEKIVTQHRSEAYACINRQSLFVLLTK